VLHMGEGMGFLGWKETLLITLSVQLATAPLVIGQFQNFSFTSFIGSMAIVWMLPFLIGGGLILALVSFVSLPLAALLHGFVAALIEYASVVIHVCARLAIPFNPQIGFMSAACYYTVFIALIYWFYYAQTRAEPATESVALTPEKAPSSGQADTFTILELP
jgi:hypothetical protein